MALRPYVDRFNQEARAYGLHSRGTIVRFAYGLPIPGFCDGKKVFIDYQTWTRFGEEEREWVIFHELGHCELGRGHNHQIDNALEYGCPASFMADVFPGVYCLRDYKNKRGGLIKELFQR